MGRRIGLSLGGGLAVSLAFCIGALAAPQAGEAPASPRATTVRASANAASVKVLIKDGRLGISARAVSAGKVLFVVKNAGKTKHSFVIIRSDLHHHLLTVKGKRVLEKGAVGRIKAVAPGATKRVTRNLAPGKYVLICNEAGHYKKGEYLAFTVTSAGTTPAAPQTTEVSVSMFEMGFKLSQTKVPWGTVIFTVTNDGKVEHDFSFGSRGGGTPLLKPGESAKLTVAFPKPGLSKYTYVCTVPGHYAAGMYGVLTVY